MSPTRQLAPHEKDPVARLRLSRKFPALASHTKDSKRRVPELIPVLGSQPAGDVSHKPAVDCHYFPPGSYPRNP